MQIDKSQILDMLRSKGQDDQAQQADQQLPEKVDTDQHKGMLDSLGIDMGSLGGLGGLGGAAGKLLG